MSPSDTDLSADVLLALQRAATVMDAAVAPNTKRAYKAGWRTWEDWCRWHNTPVVPAAPEAVAGFLAERAREGRAISSIQLALASIQYGHRERNHRLDRAHPVIANVLKGIARLHARPVASAPAFELEDLRSLVNSIEGDGVRACRDRAISIVNFFGALRRSESASLDLVGRSPVEVAIDRVVLNLTGTKTSRHTQPVVLPARGDAICPVRAIRAYLAAAQIDSGPLWRSLSKSDTVLARRLSETGISHVLRERLGDVDVLRNAGCSSHSWRVGFASSAAKAGAPEALIAASTRHRSLSTLRRYVRVTDQLKDSAAAWL